ncbi:LOW QUALITY PROTEIN: von Willebrand factor A domain-containing protein 2 [Mergus octosetaceus]
MKRFVITNLLPLAFICVFRLPQVLLESEVQEIHADQETIGKISAADQPIQCSAAVDILFLLDGSYSIGRNDFNGSKYFAGKLCDALDIDPDRVRVGLIQFSSTPRIEFPLDSYQNKQEVEERIQSTRFRGGSKKIEQALKILCKGFPGGRNSTVPEILVIISDGKSNGSTATLAMQLKERGITVFAVGIKSQGLGSLHVLASEPTEQHMFSAEDADGATNGLYSALAGSICTATAPGSPGPGSDLITEKRGGGV